MSKKLKSRRASSLTMQIPWWLEYKIEIDVGVELLAGRFTYAERVIFGSSEKKSFGSVNRPPGTNLQSEYTENESSQFLFFLQLSHYKCVPLIVS
jgi:hypothetical protein